ncbi:MAG: helix-turn-helix domain-containing protein [Bacteroidota bacterium]|nr:helix-turn-helix domain-containing protein [Bacteroidota bacterium]
MAELFENTTAQGLSNLGNGIAVRKTPAYVEVWRNGGFLFVRRLDPRETTPEFRHLIVELAQDYRAQKTKLSEVFGISRQTIDNWIDFFNDEGIAGLVNSTKNKGNNHRGQGNKARELEAAHRENRINNQRGQLSLFDIRFSGGHKIDKKDEPYDAPVEKHDNRYAGVFAIFIILTAYFKWFNWVIGLFGSGYKISQIFVLMAAKNIRSIEQLKNIRKKEAGAIIGFKRVGSVSSVWSLFYQSATMKLSKKLIKSFFVWQMRTARISNRFWFVDGHVLPYTGGKRMHKIYNTKRRLAELGSVNYVTTDLNGRIVDFDICEGGSDLRRYLFDQQRKWEPHLKEMVTPVKVFDREGDGCKFFYQMYCLNNPFITWEKNINSKKLEAFSQSDFTEKLTVNGKEYRYMETTKDFVFEDENKEKHPFSLRRFYILNTANKTHTAGLAYNGNAQLSAEECVFGILNRWGASENTFKHIESKHPFTYRPGFKLVKSQNQTLVNPEIKAIDKKIKAYQKQYQKKCRQLADKEKKLSSNGHTRKNDTYTRIKDEIQQIKHDIDILKQQKKILPERIDVEGLQDYKSFKEHDNEGKNIFDFATALVWNARKKGVELLSGYYPFKNDLVDLFYAIINCHGKVSVNEKEIKVILEPLEQSSRRSAQIEFCKRLTQLGAKTPGKKAMVIQVAQY